MLLVLHDVPERQAEGKQPRAPVVVSAPLESLRLLAIALAEPRDIVVGQHLFPLVRRVFPSEVNAVATGPDHAVRLRCV